VEHHRLEQAAEFHGEEEPGIGRCQPNRAVLVFVGTTELHPTADAEIVEHLKKPLGQVQRERESVCVAMPTKQPPIPEERAESFAASGFAAGHGVFEKSLIGLKGTRLGRFAQAMITGGDEGVHAQQVDQDFVLVSAELKDQMLRVTADELHLVTLHGGLQAVALQLMNIMFRTFHAFAGEDTLALMMDLQHVPLGLGLGPAEHFPKHVRHVIHEVDRIVPADHQEAGLQVVPRIGLSILLDFRQRRDARAGPDVNRRPHAASRHHVGHHGLNVGESSRLFNPPENEASDSGSFVVDWSSVMQPVNNLRVREMIRLAPPAVIKAEQPMAESANNTVVHGRHEVQRILNQDDPRMLVIVGPCSIHDVDSAFEYAQQLNRLRLEVVDSLCVVMRVYFEKPRTTIGWKGLINDPHLDGSYDIETGLKTARDLLLRINELGLPVATEFLDPIVPQYIADLVSWAAVGARTTESQTHREMASGLSMPVGFKNGTDGSLQIAIDAMGAARHPHSFLGIDQQGVTSIVRTAGNRDGHLVLRGGRLKGNYDPQSITEAEAALKGAGLPGVLMVDCSHANSAKQHARQEEVWNNVIEQRLAGNRALIGLMVESFIEEGNQPFPAPRASLRRGVSITDACVNWTTTERMLRHGAERMRVDLATPTAHSLAAS
jgi:3-deoxy-7-phosphoheptulonate synthase